MLRFGLLHPDMVLGGIMNIYTLQPVVKRESVRMGFSWLHRDGDGIIVYKMIERLLVR
jgi:hypothetical protein